MGKSINRDVQSISRNGSGVSAAAPLPLLPRLLEKYNTEEIMFLDVGATQNALKGKTLTEIFPASYQAFAAMFDSGRTNLTAIYFQLSAGFPEGFKVRIPTLKVTKTSYQIGLLEYATLNPKNSVFRSDSEKEFSSYIPTTLQKVHFLQDKSGAIQNGSYSRATDTIYDLLFYLTGSER